MFSTKVKSLEQAAPLIRQWKAMGEEIVFTNGCFDLLHFGHLSCLADAKAQGTKLIVGLNSDASIKRLKGETRPIQDEKTRAAILGALTMTDLIIIFEEDTPLNLIRNIIPDKLVKGGDYTPDQIVGADIVLQHGGEVMSLPFVDGFSTSNYVKKMKN